MKRFFESIDDCGYHKNKKQKINHNNPLQPIFATQLRNYLIGDPIVDYLKIYESPEFNSFTSFIMDKGVEFEKKVIEYISTTIHPVVSCSEFFNESGLNRTIQLMKAGTPIIHSAPVYNSSNNTGGIIDLLIRSDYIHILTVHSPISTEEK